MAMTSVYVDITEDNYVPAPFDNDYVKGPQVEWIKAHIRGYWNWGLEKHSSSGWKLCYRFSDSNEAILFKLTWGGI